MIIIIYSIIFLINYTKLKENSINNLEGSNRESNTNSSTRNSNVINNSNDI